jgi:uncharacterized protein YjeT (DUF2065 family)
MPKLSKDQQQTNQELRKILILGIGAIAVGVIIIIEPLLTASTYNLKPNELNWSSPHAWGLMIIGIGLILLYAFIKPQDNNDKI